MKRRTVDSALIRDALPFDLAEFGMVPMDLPDEVLMELDPYYDPDWEEKDDDRFLDDQESAWYDGYDLDPI